MEGNGKRQKNRFLSFVAVLILSGLVLAAGVFVILLYKREEKKEETIKNFSCDPISRRLKLHE